MTTSGSSLKNEGNALFGKHNFVAAAAKYREAIALDDQNAILHANLSACHFSMKQFNHAKKLAQKAVELDPSYSKAWSRLANAHTALQEWPLALNAWQGALNSLPKTNLSQTQISQRKQYESGLNEAQEAYGRWTRHNIAPGATLSDRTRTTGAEPWTIAIQMLPQLSAQNRPFSSAWVISSAYQAFSDGVAKMSAIKSTSDERGGEILTGEGMSIVPLLDGIMRDDRAFHIKGSIPGWLKAFEIQLRLDVRRYEAWMERDPETVMQKCAASVRSKGWNFVRPALSVTVRQWVMRAFLKLSVGKKFHTAVEQYSQALEILAWGRSFFANVPDKTRGMIFSSTFIRGVRRLYLNALMAEYVHDRSKTDILETLYQEAQDMVADVDTHPFDREASPDVDTGAQLAYFPYCTSTGLVAQAFYQVEMASQDTANSVDYYSNAADLYLEAAESIPDDDLDHPWFLRCSLIYSPWNRVDDALHLMQRIRETLPSMENIWERMSPNRDRRTQYDRVLKEEEKLRVLLAEGKTSLEDRFSPDWSSA